VLRAGDAPGGALAGEAVAILGYGNLGRTVALNLRDSGIPVRIGNREDEYADRARADGFEVNGGGWAPTAQHLCRAIV
jgi:ketol-acid reductoisomerase